MARGFESKSVADQQDSAQGSPPAESGGASRASTSRRRARWDRSRRARDGPRARDAMEAGGAW